MSASQGCKTGPQRSDARRRPKPAQGNRRNSSRVTIAPSPPGSADRESSGAATAIARRFVQARLAGRALDAYPGTIPADLAAAYAIQDAALGLWPGKVAGWKIGRVPPTWEPIVGAHRIAGPIFAEAVWPAAVDGEREFPVFEGGFAAVEAEYIFRLDRDAPAERTDWTVEDAAGLAGELIVGVEPAGSPLATINDLGPAVVVSDFGNNAGLILGPAVRNWRDRLDAFTCETFIEGRSVGRGGAASIPGGPLESLRFLLELNARRGRPLRAGDLISTGAATGIHDIRAGQSARIVFDGIGEVRCRAAPTTGRAGG